MDKNKHLHILGIVLGLIAFLFSAIMLIAWIPMLKISLFRALTYIIIYALGLLASLWLINFLSRKVLN